MTTPTVMPAGEDPTDTLCSAMTNLCSNYPPITTAYSCTVNGHVVTCTNSDGSPTFTITVTNQ
jgi:hypothetical protein